MDRTSPALAGFAGWGFGGGIDTPPRGIAAGTGSSIETFGRVSGQVAGGPALVNRGLLLSPHRDRDAFGGFGKDGRSHLQSAAADSTDSSDLCRTLSKP